jgi:uncharacterized protein (TIGR02145 family)
MIKKYLKKVLILFIAVLFTQINYAQTVTIGKQVWTSKNLDVTTFRNGDPIPEAKTNEEWKKAGNNRQPAWCYYVNSSSIGTKYGKLYNWYAVNDPRGLAPKGYHIPSDAEWAILAKYLGGDRVAGGKMKTKSEWYIPNTDASNSSGFAALPSGHRRSYGTFDNIDMYGCWWSSSKQATSNASCRCLSYDSGVLGYDEDEDKGIGFPVRCLRD